MINVSLELLMSITIAIFFLKGKFLEDKRNIFSRFTTESMKGLAMIAIMLHHIRNSLEASSFVLGATGYIGTGIFFLISGYGNELSLRKTDNTTFKWLWKKIKKIYLPFLACYILWEGFYLFSQDGQLDFFAILEDLLTISLPNMINWFPKIILLCFLLHWISIKGNKENRKRVTIISCIFLVYVLVLKVTRISDYWYLSVMCYPLGIMLANKDSFVSYEMQNKKINCLLCVGGFWVSVALLILSKNLSIIKIIVAMSFSISLYIYSNIFEVKTKILAWVGSNSFEFYLFHLLVIQCLYGLVNINWELYIISVFVGSFSLVFSYNLVKNKIEKYFKTL